jgi:hypothetical protein
MYVTTGHRAGGVAEQRADRRFAVGHRDGRGSGRTPPVRRAERCSHRGGCPTSTFGGLSTNLSRLICISALLDNWGQYEGSGLTSSLSGRCPVPFYGHNDWGYPDTRMEVAGM